MFNCSHTWTSAAFHKPFTEISLAAFPFPEGFKSKWSYPKELGGHRHTGHGAFFSLPVSSCTELPLAKHFSLLAFPTEKDIFGNLILTMSTKL